MANMNMIQALNSAMDIMLGKDPSVVIMGEEGDDIAVGMRSGHWQDSLRAAEVGNQLRGIGIESAGIRWRPPCFRRRDEARLA